MSTPKAVRVKTTDGWQDIGYQGPQGPFAERLDGADPGQAPRR